MLSKLLKSKHALENVGPEANREKTTMKLKHINFEFAGPSALGMVRSQKSILYLLIL